jgi:hypothetical protein
MNTDKHGFWNALREDNWMIRREALTMQFEQELAEKTEIKTGASFNDLRFLSLLLFRFRMIPPEGGTPYVR